MMRKTRTKIVYATMKLLTPGLYKRLRALSAIPDSIDYMPRPMIKYLAKLNRVGLVGAEVGVSYGANSVSIFETLNVKRLYAVDPYLPYLEKGVTNKVHLNFKETAVNSLLGKPVTWLILPSVDAANKVDELLDFVYIDANHAYDFVKADIEAWYPYVKVGGVIGGHDFDWNEDGVIKAVTEFANSKNIHLNIQYPDWWCLKE